MARHASLYVAPNGCTIGTTTIPPGMSLAFDSAVLGVDVKVSVAVTPRPLAIAASLSIGTIDLKGLKVQNTQVAFEISPTVKSLTFSADAEVLGATARVRGSFKLIGGVSAISFSGTFATPNLGGFQLNDLTVDFDYLSVPSTITIAAHVDVAVLTSTATIDVGFTVIGGRVLQANGSADLTIPIGSGANQFTLTGHGSFEFFAGNFPTIQITGSASAGGRTLATVSAAG